MSYYQIEIRDRDGKLLRRFRRKSRSYIQQWNEIVCVQCGYKSDFSMKDTGGTDRDVDRGAYSLYMEAGEDVDEYGIRVGTGTTAVAIDDNALATPIADGVGSGQMYHYAVTVADASVSGSSCSFTVTRVIGNQSGATISVTEIGIYFVAYENASPRYFLGIRDVLASSVAVPDGGAITVEYTIKVTV